MIRKHPKAACETCPLANRPYVPSYIPADVNLIIVGEAPGQEETVRGRPFVGASGLRLGHAVKTAGQDPNKMARLNVCCCQPVDNADPPPEAILSCLPRLTDDLNKVAETKVLGLGKVAAETLLELIGHQDKVTLPISHRRSRWFQSTPSALVRNKWLLTTWHPAYVLRKPTEAPVFYEDVSKAYQDPTILSPITKEPRLVVPSSIQELEELLDQCEDGAWVAFDIETSNTNWYWRPHQPADSILLVALCWDISWGIAISDEMLYEDPDTAVVLERFMRRVKICAHNGKFDVLFCRSQLGWGTWCRIDFDTMLAHYALNENERHGLKELAQSEFGLPNYEELIIKEFLRSQNDDYSKIPFHKLALYAIWDTAVTLLLRRMYSAQLAKQNRLEWPLLNLLMPAQDRFTLSELWGVPIDQAYVQRASDQLKLEMESLATQMRVMVNQPNLNPNASGQIASVLYDVLRLPVPATDKKVKRKTTQRPTDKNALFQLKGAHPFIDLLGQYRRVAKIRSSYLENLLGYVGADGRVHPTFVVIGTEVGRLAMKEPANQTIPRPSDYYGAIARGAFVAATEEEQAEAAAKGDEWVLVIVDYSQAELRCAAHYSQEPFLIRAYEEDRDLHDEGTLSMYGTPEKVGGKLAWKEKRVHVKMFNFAYLYGGNEHSFAQASGLPLTEAKAFVHRYEANMPVLAQWKRDQYALACRQGYVETIFGRRRHFPVIDRRNKALMDEIRKASVHAVVAGTASDLTTLAAIRLIDQGIQVILLVHDSIIVRCLRSQAAEISSHVTTAMLGVANQYLNRVKWKVDVDVTSRWATPPQSLTASGVQYMPGPQVLTVDVDTAFQVVKKYASEVGRQSLEAARQNWSSKKSFGNQEALISVLDAEAKKIGLYQTQAWQQLFS